MEWLCRFPRPKQCGFDDGGEFVGGEFQELLASYGIEPKSTIVKNPRGNMICQPVQLTIGDILRTMTFEGEEWFKEMNRTLQSEAWAARSTVSKTTDYSPGHLVFSKDLILSINIKVDWIKLNTIKQQAAKRTITKKTMIKLHTDIKLETNF